jgi:hypothetical protein
MFSVFRFFRGVTWKELKVFVETETKGKNFNILTQLQSLWSQTRDILGNEENSDIIDEAAILMLRMFLDQKLVMLKHITQLKKIFGNVSSQQVNKICQVSIRTILFVDYNNRTLYFRLSTKLAHN